METPSLENWDHVTGLVGSRALVWFAGKCFSPVYGHQGWFPNTTEVANCAIGCAKVPSDRHQGCGFHAHFDVRETQNFVHQIRGTADAIVLVECFGRIVTHEKGFRAAKAKIIAILDWNPQDLFFAPLVNPVADWFSVGNRQVRPTSIPHAMQKYFSVPFIDSQEATSLITRQKVRLLDNDPDISFRSQYPT